MIKLHNKLKSGWQEAYIRSRSKKQILTLTAQFFDFPHPQPITCEDYIWKEIK